MNDPVKSAGPFRVIVAVAVVPPVVWAGETDTEAIVDIVTAKLRIFDPPPGTPLRTITSV
jgi:hypothetical protein